jgi:hypothetical protein
MRYLIFIFSFVFCAVDAQTDRQTKFTLRLDRLTLEKAMEHIAAQTGYTFSYSDDVIPLETPVQLAVENVDIRELLQALFRNLPVDFRISSNRILLRKVPPPLFHTIRGTVTDEFGEPIPGVSVVVANVDPLMGSVTDANGKFHIARVPVGRITVHLSSVGYYTEIFSNMLLSTGKELVLNVSLRESVISMDEVEIFANRDSLGFVNGFRHEGRTFNIEEAKRFAGSFADPARMAASFAGVTGASDESNAMIVRGNSPRGVLWRVNGIEVPNPNHFATEGASNGVISVLSANVVNHSTLLKGAFSPAYGNALSAVLDVKLREGNVEQREHSFQVGALGVEASTEGPLNKNKSGSYLVNYRYSTLNLLNKVGAELQEIGKYSDYQDVSFHTSFHSRAGGTLSVFGIGGKSRSDKPMSNGRDSDVSEVVLSGMTYEAAITKQSLLNSSLSWSGTHISNDRQIISSGTSVSVNENYTKQYFRGNVSVIHKLNSTVDVQSGFIFTRLYYDFFLRNVDPSNSVYTEIFNFKEKGSANIVQAFASARQTFSKKIRTIYGVHFLNFGLTDDFSVEPRARFEWDVTSNATLSFLAGKHSRVENLQFYLARDHQAGGDEIKVNQDLGFTRANHFGIRYQRKLGMADLSLETYYQKLYNAPFQADASSWYSPINEDSGFVTDSLDNRGEGKNYGLEISMERRMSNNFYYLANLSLYESLIGVKGDRSTNSLYNGNYIFHLLTGKEFTLRRNSRTGINLKGTAGGGRRYTPIDLTTSQEKGYQVMDWSKAYDARLPVYFRLDFQLDHRMNFEKYALEIRLDVQNFTNHRNTAYFYYDAGQQQIKEKVQVGVLPVLTCRIDF